MTPEQIEVARHALGLCQGRKVAFRNHFVAGEGSSDFALWLEMVDQGYAIRRPGAKLPFGGDDLFHLTRNGAILALRPGESLETGGRYPDVSPTLGSAS